jgi:hypothetical protein
MWGSEGIAPPSWPQQWMKVSSSRHCALATLLCRESAPGTHSVGGWVGLGTSLDASQQTKNSCSCRELNLCHPDLSLLTDRVITALKEWWHTWHAKIVYWPYSISSQGMCLKITASILCDHVLWNDWWNVKSLLEQWLLNVFPFMKLLSRNVFCLFLLPYVLPHVSMKLSHV